MRRLKYGGTSEVLRFFERFKTFAVQGSVIEMTLSAMFYNIVYAMATSILMPIIGVVAFGFDLSDLTITLKDPVVVEGGKQLQEAVKIDVGYFLQTVLQFLMVAIPVFLLLQYFYPKVSASWGKFHRPKQEPPSSFGPVQASVVSALLESQKVSGKPSKTEEELLVEIRDLLRQLNAERHTSSSNGSK